MTALAFAVVALTNAWGSIAVDPTGATLASYVPAGGRETIFHSSARPNSDPRKACFNGGAPLCFPWVYDDEGRRAELHGCVWGIPWRRLEPKNPDELRFGVEADGYSVECAFRLGPSLNVSLSVRNDIFRDTDRSFCFAFHPFFEVSDVEKVSISGLAERPIPGREHVKGVFLANEAAIVDPGFGRRIVVSSSDTKRLMLWNCGKDPHPDYAPGEWRRFVCLEPANNVAADSMRVKPGETRGISISVRVEELK